MAQIVDNIFTNSGYIGMTTTAGWTTVSENLPIITRQQLREYCKAKTITKEIFENLNEIIPMNADLLTELTKIGETNHPYVKRLLRNKKLKRILK